jgi:hypothetical protein
LQQIGTYQRQHQQRHTAQTERDYLYRITTPMSHQICKGILQTFRIL